MSAPVLEPRWDDEDDPESDGDCRVCHDPFGEGEFARSRVDPTQCHYCYTTGAERDGE